MWSLPPQPCSPGCYKKFESSHGHIKEPSLHCLTPLSPIYMPWNQKVWEQIIGIPRQAIERTWECVTFWITWNNARLTVRPAKNIIKTQVNICPGSAWELGSIFWILLALVFSPIHLWLCCVKHRPGHGPSQTCDNIRLVIDNHPCWNQCGGCNAVDNSQTSVSFYMAISQYIHYVELASQLSGKGLPTC